MQTSVKEREKISKSPIKQHAAYKLNIGTVGTIYGQQIVLLSMPQKLKETKMNGKMIRDFIQLSKLS